MGVEKRKRPPFTQKQTALWTMRSGKRIRICDMTDIHLLNALKLIERYTERVRKVALQSAYAVADMVSGEMAQECAEAEIDRLESGDESDFLPEIYWRLYNDALRRGLTPKEE